jgi:group I intron endonuclease
MEPRRYYVYLITNTVNGKVYVGKTYDVAKRWCEHKHSGKNPSHHCRLISRAIAKYGTEAFRIEVLSEHSSEAQALLAEELEISERDSQNKTLGYNLTSGGESGLLSKDSRERIANTLKGHPVTEDARAKIRKARANQVLSVSQLRALAKGRELPHGPISEETRAKMRAAKVGRRQTEDHRSRIGESSRRAAQRKAELGLQPNGKPLISDTKKDRVRLLRTNGETMQAIADAVEISLAAVFKILRGGRVTPEGTPRKGRKMSAEFKEKIRNSWIERHRRSNAE